MTKREPRTAPLDRWFERIFGDHDPDHLGTGWASGVTSVFLGAPRAGRGRRLWFPESLSTAQFRALYPMAVLRAVIEGAIAIAFLAAVASLLLRRRKVLGLTGGGLALAAALLGGGQVAVAGDLRGTATLGLDWFLLNLLLLALLFVPLERLFPQRPGQGTFRPEWTTDGVYFLVSHVLVQALSYVILLPATTLGRSLAPRRPAGRDPRPASPRAVPGDGPRGRPRPVRRAPGLPPGSPALALPRASTTRAATSIGWPARACTSWTPWPPAPSCSCRSPSWASRRVRSHAYLVFVSFHAVFIHANVRFRLTALEPFLVTPRFHHWHHAADPEARDRNFAVHLPWLDRLFGTRPLPAGALARVRPRGRRTCPQLPGPARLPVRPALLR